MALPDEFQIHPRRRQPVLALCLSLLAWSALPAAAEAPRDAIATRWQAQVEAVSAGADTAALFVDAAVTPPRSFDRSQPAIGIATIAASSISAELRKE